ncbi:nucleotidyltransferase family protein [Enterocloster sp. OA13]|uniref:nucleotidyltransferase family protein n=1 Tax=Enterocloster sp. OA13 TaxID=2914161 RepID=UPI000471A05B|nr:nucleotidyltransferase family protein [Enterocloster sp. OA13]
MDRLIFEGRFLVNLVGGIVRQDDLKAIHSRIDWEHMYRTADYHKIANIVYLGILGNGEKVPERWMERFFGRYQEALFYSDTSEDAEREILTLLDMMGIPCVILTTSRIRLLYQIQEMSANNPLRLKLDGEDYSLAKGYLVDLGYETERIYKGYGERMGRPSGFCVELYHKIPFRTRPYEKGMQRIMETAFIRNSFQHVRTISIENRYVFMAAQAAYHYTADELLIREVLDLYLYHKTWREEMNREYITNRLKEFQIDGLAEKILQIAYMWFGSKEDILGDGQPDDMGVYDVLENRILSRGAITRETDHQALRLASLIKQDIEKERRKDRRAVFMERLEGYRTAFMRKFRWLFPEFRYMCAIYPFLEKIPVLLPVYWARRGIRLMAGLLAGKVKDKDTYE